MALNNNIEINIITIINRETLIKNEDLNNPNNLRLHVITKRKILCLRDIFLIISEIKRINPDVVHIHGTYPPYSTIAFFLKMLTDYRLITTVHGSLSNELKSNFLNRIRPETYLHLLLEKSALKNSNIIIAVSEAIKTDVEKTIDDRKKTLVIPNGIDFNYFQEISFNNKFHNPSIFFVGRLVKIKGCDLLIKAVQLIKMRIPNIKVYIAGDGAQRKKLERLVQKLEIERNVIFLGYVSGNKKISMFKSVDVCVFPSRYESFGIVVLEAMACGKAIVASKVGGIPSLVKDGENGILFEPENIEELSRSIIRLLENEKLRERMGSISKEIAKKYSWECMADRTYKLYENICNDEVETQHKI